MPKKHGVFFGRFAIIAYFCTLIGLKTKNSMKKTTLILTLLLWLSSAFSAVPDLKFRRLDTRDGLSNQQTNCILRDSKGFVWVGTPYGLNRYDGYRVKTYYSDMRDTTTLRTNFVDGIQEDADGRLWLKQGIGYTIFDPVTERCDRHPEVVLEEMGISGGLEYLYIDSKKDFWVKTYNDGFYHYSQKTKKARRYAFGYGPQDFNADMGVSSMNEFGNNVMVLSFNGEMLIFDRERNAIIKKEMYLHNNQLVQDRDCKLRIDSKGNYWVVTQPFAFVWERKTGKWHHSVPTALRNWGFTDVPDEMAVWDVCEDPSQRIWLATDHGGLYVIDKAEKDLRQFLYNKYDESTLSDNTLRSIYRDQMGRMWVGTYQNGLNLYVGNTSSFRNLELGVVNTICFDKKGYSWLGTNDAGIIRYDNHTGEQVVYNKENSGIGSNTMVGSLAHSDGSVWFGTYEGGLIHIKDGQVTNYRATGDTLGLANNNVWTCFEDQWGNVWIGTLGGGVQRIDKRTGRMRTFNISNSGLTSDYISSISMTKKGWLLVAHSHYCSLINPKTFRVVNLDITKNRNGIPITEMSIMAIEDSRGLIWQGSTSGATIWDPKTGEVYLIDMRQGLFGTSVTGIVEDDKHTLWMVTDYGISNVIPQRQDDGRYSFIVRSFNSREGLQNGPYNQRSICYTNVGLILVGGQGGLDIINPRNMEDNRVKEVPVFSGLQVADRDVAVGEEVDGRVILDRALNYCDHIRLRYGDQFTVQLASTSGEVHNRSRFVYMLEGVNGNWVKTSELNPNINFTSLRYGDYTLHVRMLNDDGTIGEQEVVLGITVVAPFWRARWALLLYVVAVLVGVWWWRRWFMRRQAERMRIEQMSRELEKQQWMSEIRLQLERDGLLVKTPAPPQEELAFQPVVDELVGFVKRRVEGFKLPPESNQVKLSFISSLNRLTMRFDPDLIGRVVDTLLANSARFSPSGSRVRVSIAEVDNQAEVSVSDRGLGIPEAVREHMFDDDIDSGVGFALIRRIVELHGGSVAVDDNPGGGTIFKFLLPIDAKMPADAAADDIEEAVLMDD